MDTAKKQRHPQQQGSASAQKSQTAQPTQPPKARVIKKKSTYTVKTVFDSPYTVRWPGVGDKQQADILEQLRKELGIYRKAKRSPNKHLSKRQQDKRAQSGGDVLPVSTSTIDPSAEETDETKADKGPKSGDYLCLGINHVTRALERDELCLIVVCKDADPPRLVQHLPYMAFLKHVPLCALSQRGSTSEMGKIFGLKTMLALGFKKRRDSPHRDLVAFIQDRTPELDIPWLRSGGELPHPSVATGKRKDVERGSTEKEKEMDKGGAAQMPKALAPLRIKQVTAKRARVENK